MVFFEFNELLQLFLFNFVLVAIPIAFLTSKKLNFSQILKFLKLDKFSTSSFFRQGFILFVLAYSIFLVEMAVLNCFNLDDSYKVEEVLVQSSVVFLFFAVFIVPVTEEILFRGFLLKQFGILPSSIVFGFIHAFYGSFAEVLATFTIGICFALFVKKVNSLYPAIFAHFLLNLVAVISTLYF